MLEGDRRKQLPFPPADDASLTRGNHCCAAWCVETRDSLRFLSLIAIPWHFSGNEWFPMKSYKHILLPPTSPFLCHAIALRLENFRIYVQTKAEMNNSILCQKSEPRHQKIPCDLQRQGAWFSTHLPPGTRRCLALLRQHSSFHLALGIFPTQYKLEEKRKASSSMKLPVFFLSLLSCFFSVQKKMDVWVS